jgi:hypothetical protein
VDPLMVKEGEFFVETYDSFMHSPMFEMAAPKHVLFLDEFPYYYTRSLAKESFTESYYSTVVAKNIVPCNPI